MRLVIRRWPGERPGMWKPKRRDGSKSLIASDGLVKLRRCLRIRNGRASARYVLLMRQA